MNFIKKIFDKGIDRFVHLQFQKFGKGEFRNRALIKAKKTKNNFNISTTSEFTNELVNEISKKIENKVRVTGAIISTNDLTGKLDFKEKKQFQGVKRYLIDKEMSKEEIHKLLEEFPESFFALSFEVGNTTLKIKPKAPKLGKPGKKEEEKVKPDFCKIKTDDEEIGKSFVFEKSDFKEAEIDHIFIIENLKIPEELKNSDDFSKIRKESKRVGKIIRNAVIDGEKIVKESEFEI
jgi:predicted transposase YbfD/YdcC